MSRRTRWIVAALAALLLAGFAARAVMSRMAASSAAASAAIAAPPQAVELAPGDVAIVQRTELVARLAVSGGLKAVDTAMVKARVAAEVQQLTVREGDRVSAGQLIGRLDDTEFRLRLRQAEEQAAAAQAQLDIAPRTLENNKALVEQGFISKNALDNAVSNAGAARASLLAARATADLARKAVRDSEIRAPIAGLVAQRLVQPGERVPLDARLVEIVDLSRIELEAAVSPEDVLALRVGQSASVSIDGLAEPVPARVVRINPGTQAGTRAVMAYLQLQPGADAAALRQGAGGASLGAAPRPGQALRDRFRAQGGWWHGRAAARGDGRAGRGESCRPHRARGGDRLRPQRRREGAARHGGFAARRHGAEARRTPVGPRRCGSPASRSRTPCWPRW
jgi:RND family efflux transporter MFP subunit